MPQTPRDECFQLVERIRRLEHSYCKTARSLQQIEEALEDAQNELDSLLASEADRAKGITLPERVVNLLRERPDEALSPREVSAALRLRPGAARVVLGKLARCGTIRRVFRGRYQAISLNGKGGES